MRRVAFVVNPAGAHHVDLLTQHCQEAADANAWEPQFILTEAGDASSKLYDHLCRFTDEEGEKLVFAVGGDGTVRACARNLAGTGVALAVLPRGTANLFARALGIPTEIGAALKTGFGGEERLVDLAFANGEPFVAMAGIGIDAAVVESTPRLLKERFGWVGYAVAALPLLAGPLHELEVQLDDREPFARLAHAVVVANVGTLPGGFSLLPGAVVDDGLLDVAVIDPKGLLGWASLARRAVAGAHRGGSFEHFQAVAVQVSSATELPRQLDGDVCEHGRSLSARVHHNALLVRAPEPERVDRAREHAPGPRC